MTARRIAWFIAIGAAIIACGTSSTESSPITPKANDNDAGRESCPAGLGATFRCDGARRIRCVDDRLLVEPCIAGCEAGEDGEAVCSCGSHPTFSRWNCVPEGGRASCAGGKSWIVDSCNGKSCEAGASGVSDSCEDDSAVAAVVRELGASCGTLASGVRCSIAVRDLTTGARASWDGHVAFNSASSAKVFWVGAGLFDTSVDAVEPYAKPIFESSDNIATGHVLDLLSSPDRVNTFFWQDAELADVGFCSWNYGGTRKAQNCPSLLPGQNFFTTNEAVSFLARLWDASLLGRDKSRTLLSWMQLSPRQGYGGWLGTQLPASARASMRHKAGWLPPESVPGFSNANDIGIIDLPGGGAYAVAFALAGAPSQAAYDDEELPLLEYLSCRVYHAMAGDDASSCTKP